MAAALKAQRAAEAFFLGTAPSYRRNVLRWLHGAKREATRIARIKQIVEASERAEKIPQM